MHWGHSSMPDNNSIEPTLFIYESGKTSDRVKVWSPTSGVTNSAAIQENKDYIFELENCPTPDQTDLYIDDIALEALFTKRVDTMRWRWSPGFYAGSVEFQLVISPVQKYRFELITDPDLRKLSRERFDKMVEEILEDTLALFSLSSFRAGISRGIGKTPPPIARLEYLRSRVEKIDQVIHQINRHPVRILKGQEEWVISNRARSFLGTQFLHSLNGNNLGKIEDPKILENMHKSLKGYFPKKVKQQLKISGLNIREHQEIKCALKNWAAILDMYAAILAGSKSSDSELREQAALWANRCRSLGKRLLKLLDLPLFSDVSDQSSGLVISPVFRRVPEYRLFFQLYRDMNLGVSNLFGNFLNLPLAHTYDLYELWCFLRMARALHRKFGNVVFDDLFRNYAPDTGSVTIPDGQVDLWIPDFGIFSFKKSYSEFWRDSQKRGSFSRTMIPDLSLEVLNGKSQIKIIVLDAKYRIERQLNEAISSIHTYRDAIVQGEEGDEQRFERIVIAAYLLTPYIPSIKQEDNWKDLNMPGRLFHREYRGNFKFGAATLIPGMTLNDLDHVLDEILADASI